MSSPQLRVAGRGFTLIELLVVIAIIGILASIILASLSSARSKGTDAATESELQSIQEQAEIFYDSNNFTYGSFVGSTFNHTPGGCEGGTTNMFNDSTIQSALSAIYKQSGGDIGCVANASYYVVGGALIAGGWWCVDSNGNSKPESGTMPSTPPLPTKCP